MSNNNTNNNNNNNNNSNYGRGFKKNKFNNKHNNGKHSKDMKNRDWKDKKYNNDYEQNRHKRIKLNNSNVLSGRDILMNEVNINDGEKIIKINKTLIVMDNGLLVKKIIRNTNCVLTIIKHPPIWKQFKLDEMNNYFNNHITNSTPTLISCITNLQTIDNKIVLHINNYNNLKLLVNIISQIAICEHNQINNCSFCNDQSLFTKIEIEHKLNNNNEIIIFCPSNIDEQYVRSHYENEQMPISECVKIYLKNYMGMIKYRIKFTYESDTNRVLLEQIVPKTQSKVQNKLILEGEIRLKIKQWSFVEEIMGNYGFKYSYKQENNNCMDFCIKDYVKNSLEWNDILKSYPFIKTDVQFSEISIRNGDYYDIYSAVKLLDELLNPKVIVLGEAVLISIRSDEKNIIDQWVKGSSHISNVRNCIEINYNNGIIYIHGNIEDKKRIHQNIINYFNEPFRSHKTNTIDINTNQKKYLINNLQNIKNFGVICTLRDKTLKLEGIEYCVENALDFIESLKISLGSDSMSLSDDPNIISNEILCAFCFDNAIGIKTLSCGHNYCSECFIQMIWSASRSDYDIIKCVGCNQENNSGIKLSDIINEFSAEDFKILCKFALNKYVAKNLNTCRFCPSPDCDNIYYDDANPLWRCNNCHIVYCKECKVDYYKSVDYCAHLNITCAKLQEEKNKPKKDSDVEKNEIWLQNNTKKCPGCNINTEKNMGCLHMHCKQCQADYCWICLRIYSENVRCTSFKCNVFGTVYNPY